MKITRKLLIKWAHMNAAIQRLLQRLKKAKAAQQLRPALLAVPVLYLAACASTPNTPYSEADGPRDYGYSDSRITDNRYRINFRGNAYTTADEVKDMALLRAAELTLERDYDWFRVVTQETAETTNVIPATVPGGVVTQQVYRDCGPLGCTTTIAPAYTGSQVVTVRDVDNYTTSIEIVMGDGRLDDPTTAYDARELRNNLDRRY